MSNIAQHAARPNGDAGTEKSGEQIGLDFRLTVGLHKIGERWTIVHEHHSIPAS